MRARSVLEFALSFLFAAAVLAQGGEEKPKAAAKAPIFREVAWPAGDMKWADVPDAPPGVKVVDLWVDHARGAFASFQKLPAGFALPLHTHSADLRIVVISGTIIHRAQGKSEIRLPAGSYLVEPSTLRHATTCDAASECVVFVEGNRTFDVKIVDEEKAPAKK
jgi:anti-sigma factor ChrR (cupin superfamily)